MDLADHFAFVCDQLKMWVELAVIFNWMEEHGHH